MMMTISGSVGPIAVAAHRLMKYRGNHRYKRKHKKYDAYQCPFCDAWHIGGRRKDLRRKENA
jgi:hypothetical protein